VAPNRVEKPRKLYFCSWFSGFLRMCVPCWKAPGKRRPGATCRGLARDGARLTNAGNGSGVQGVPSLAVAAEGANAVNALAMGAQVSKHMAFVHICGQAG
jgi:hypothetical protein